MKIGTIEFKEKIDELLSVLDMDVDEMQKSLSRLNELRGLVIKRDDSALEKLLEKIRAESDSYMANKLRRQSIREELAVALDCEFEQLTLSRLEAETSTEKKAQIAQRKAELKALATELRKEHLNTALLLSDCARFNRMLLNSLLDLTRTESLIYNSSGEASRQTDTAFVNLHF